MIDIVSPPPITTDPNSINQLAALLALYEDDPLGATQDLFPWGQDELSKHLGPRTWQRELYAGIRDDLQSGEMLVRRAISSGHGIGKSTTAAHMALWALGTRINTRVVITANNENQLKQRTGAELVKWFSMWRLKPYFKNTVMSVYSPEAERNWRLDLTPWSESRPEGFAGLHNAGNRILLIFDESSGIPEIIWEITEGALTDADTQIIWLVFGNPNRNTGRFPECFTGKRAHRWHPRKIDARTVEGTNLRLAEEWIEDYGEDSDFVRVRVKGEFPRRAVGQFIGNDVVAEARTREAPDPAREKDDPAPLILGVDVAREGDDENVICPRRGDDARSLDWICFSESNLMRTAARVAAVYDELKADALFVDEGGIGAGVVDRLIELGYPVLGVNFGAQPDGSAVLWTNARGELYYNKRGEMWGSMRAWLTRSGRIWDNDTLASQLIGLEYTTLENSRKGETILLEKKRDMKRRGLVSPDRADALALTFAYPVARQSSTGIRDRYRRQPKPRYSGWAI